jgi:hypothetical protein
MLVASSPTCVAYESVVSNANHSLNNPADCGSEIGQHEASLSIKVEKRQKRRPIQIRDTDIPLIKYIKDTRSTRRKRVKTRYSESETTRMNCQLLRRH